MKTANNTNGHSLQILVVASIMVCSLATTVQAQATVPNSAAELSAGVELSPPSDSVTPDVVEVPESVLNVVKGLAAQESASVEDMNKAREAIAKMDLLIDIENRISDLEKIRRDREKEELENISPVNLSIPPGMVMPPAMGTNGNPSVPMTPVPITPALAIDRITGSNGTYSASLRPDDGGKLLRVKVGDELPDGSVVQNITSRTVILRKPSDGKTQVLKISGVDKIFGEH